MNLIERFHERYVFGRRVIQLARNLSELIPEGASVIDVGCGDGALGRRILELRPDIDIRGVEVQLRQKTYIPVEEFGGKRLPYEAEEFDAVLLVDVLHHLADPMVLLHEARRVARSAVIIKDHLRDGFFAERILRLMDWVGNARYGIPLPNTYWTRNQWDRAFLVAGLEKGRWRESLGLYSWPISWLCDRQLHFVTVLRPGRPVSLVNLENQET